MATWAEGSNLGRERGQFVALGDEKMPFGNAHSVDGDVADDKEFAAYSAAVCVDTPVACQPLEALGRHKVADLLMNFADCALQKGLASLAMPPKKAEHARVQNSRNIFALLKQKPTPSVCDDSGSKLAMTPWIYRIGPGADVSWLPRRHTIGIGPRVQNGLSGLERRGNLRMSPTIAPPVFGTPATGPTHIAWELSKGSNLSSRHCAASTARAHI